MPTTPPPSDDDQEDQRASPPQSRQSNVGRKKVRRDRSAAYRKIEKLNVQVEKLTRSAEKYKKRYNRLKSTVQPSPVKRTEGIMKLMKKQMKKEVLNLSVIVSQIKQKYRKSQNRRQKAALKDALSGRILRKYITVTRVKKSMNIYSKG